MNTPRRSFFLSVLLCAFLTLGTFSRAEQPTAEDVKQALAQTTTLKRSRALEKLLKNNKPFVRPDSQKMLDILASGFSIGDTHKDLGPTAPELDLLVKVVEKAGVNPLNLLDTEGLGGGHSDILLGLMPRLPAPQVMALIEKEKKGKRPGETREEYENRLTQLVEALVMRPVPVNEAGEPINPNDPRKIIYDMALASLRESGPPFIQDAIKAELAPTENRDLEPISVEAWQALLRDLVNKEQKGAADLTKEMNLILQHAKVLQQDPDTALKMERAVRNLFLNHPPTRTQNFSLLLLGKIPVTEIETYLAITSDRVLKENKGTAADTIKKIEEGQPLSFGGSQQRLQAAEMQILDRLREPRHKLSGIEAARLLQTQNIDVHMRLYDIVNSKGKTEKEGDRVEHALTELSNANCLPFELYSRMRDRTYHGVHVYRTMIDPRLTKAREVGPIHLTDRDLDNIRHSRTSFDLERAVADARKRNNKDPRFAKAVLQAVFENRWEKKSITWSMHNLLNKVDISDEMVQEVVIPLLHDEYVGELATGYKLRRDHVQRVLSEGPVIDMENLRPDGADESAKDVDQGPHRGILDLLADSEKCNYEVLNSKADAGTTKKKKKK